MRTSWDTAVKHLARHDMLRDILTKEQLNSIPRSNISRWKQESDDKYRYSEINELIKQEIELIKRINQSSRIKKINQSYFKLIDTFHAIISDIKGVKLRIREQKELVVNSIDCIIDYIPIDKALKVFNISRSTFENYKAIVIHKCNYSYFNWCTKRFSSQLLPMEVQTIKYYMSQSDYRYWSKASIYLKAVRDEHLKCGLSTFYKYCRLLGFKNKLRKRKSDNYNPIRTLRANQLWCADVTVFKTNDNVKHYIHFLMDHFSKYIIGFKIFKSPSALAIKELLEQAYLKYKPDKVQLLTDGGSENVNTTVSNFINSPEVSMEHIIAQKDVIFSNSMVEALNNVMKHQFLFPKVIANSIRLNEALNQSVTTYNNVRPQMSLGGNTPEETFGGLTIDFHRYSKDFKTQKSYRVQQNKRNNCKLCR